MGPPLALNGACFVAPTQALLRDRRLGAVLRRHVVETRAVAHALLVQQVLHFVRLRLMLARGHKYVYPICSMYANLILHSCLNSF